MGRDRVTRADEGTGRDGDTGTEGGTWMDEWMYGGTGRMGCMGMDESMERNRKQCHITLMLNGNNQPGRSRVLLLVYI